MKERPILFSAPMVRAILEGRKTVTRRAVKGIALDWLAGASFTPEYVASPANGLCPYGQPGDRLWVREAWRPAAWRDEGYIAVDYRASPEENRTPWLDVPEDIWAEMWPRLTDEAQSALDAGRGSIRREGDGFRWDRGDSPCRWRPSIHMPRWASRITLEIADVYVERLQDISEADAIAEGIQQCEGGAMDYLANDYAQGYSPVASFRSLWESINGAGSWDANPWVWVVEFKRVEIAP